MTDSSVSEDEEDSYFVILCGIFFFNLVFLTHNFKKKKMDKIVVSHLVCDDDPAANSIIINIIGVTQSNQVDGLVLSYTVINL